VIVASALLNLLAAVLAALRTKRLFNPFSLVLLGFALSAAITALNPFSTDLAAIDLAKSTQLYVLLFSISFVVLTALLRESSVESRGYVVWVAVGDWAFAAIAFTIFGCAAAVIAVNGFRLPINVMAEAFAAGTGVSYAEVQIPFVTPLAEGLNRVVWIFIAADWVVMGG
jgi:hypothetical protein